MMKILVLIFECVLAVTRLQFAEMLTNSGLTDSRSYELLQRIRNAGSLTDMERIG